MASGAEVALAAHYRGVIRSVPQPTTAERRSAGHRPGQHRSGAGKRHQRKKDTSDNHLVHVLTARQECPAYVILLPALA